MARLIDADALKEECMYIDDIPAVTERDIDNAPTIDAIPVEWLHKKREQMIDAAQNTPEQAIAYVLWLWKKEQEAR